jgi:soluble lytic murein transglycosylase-like protein
VNAVEGNNRCHGASRAALLNALLLWAVAAHSQTTTPVLNWHVLLTDPDPVQLTTLAGQYERAIGYRRDYGRARQLYCAAARLGYTPAQQRLAWMYAYGLGAPRDTELAAAWLEVAAAKGDRKAAKFLAFLDEPPVRRKPRCTYESRFDAYAIATSAGPDLDTGNNNQNSGEQQIASWIHQLAPGYGLDPNLIMAIVQTQSNFDPEVRPGTNVPGLMQLTPSTAARFGVKDTTDPLQNLHGGMAYIRWLLSFFQGDLQLSLAGYIAGEDAVEKHQGVPPLPETQRYIEKVLSAYGHDTHPPIEPPVEL